MKWPQRNNWLASLTAGSLRQQLDWLAKADQHAASWIGNNLWHPFVISQTPLKTWNEWCARYSTKGLFRFVRTTNALTHSPHALWHAIPGFASIFPFGHKPSEWIDALVQRRIQFIHAPWHAIPRFASIFPFGHEPSEWIDALAWPSQGRVMPASADIAASNDLGKIGFGCVRSTSLPVLTRCSRRLEKTDI